MDSPIKHVETVKKSLANEELTKNKIIPFITKLNNLTISVLFLIRIK